MNRIRGSSGSGDVVGMVLLVPAVLGLGVLVMWTGRQVDAQAQVRAAAGAGAHAGALSRSAADAEMRARETISAALLGSDSCAAVEVSIDVTRFEPGGVFAVEVSCSVERSGLELIAPPAVRPSASVEVAIDPYRALDRP